jgi:hypothetical protein
VVLNDSLYDENRVATSNACGSYLVFESFSGVQCLVTITYYDRYSRTEQKPILPLLVVLFSNIGPKGLIAGAEASRGAGFLE